MPNSRKRQHGQNSPPREQQNDRNLQDERSTYQIAPNVDIQAEARKRRRMFRERFEEERRKDKEWGQKLWGVILMTFCIMVVVTVVPETPEARYSYQLSGLILVSFIWMAYALVIILGY